MVAGRLSTLSLNPLLHETQIFQTNLILAVVQCSRGKYWAQHHIQIADLVKMVLVSDSRAKRLKNEITMEKRSLIKWGRKNPKFGW